MKLVANALQVFSQCRAQSLAPMAPNGGWEKIKSIMDSGATVSVGPPDAIKAYPVTEGAAVKAGVTYEIADGTSIPNLGERQAAVMNINGTVAAKHQQVAGVSHHLTAVRQEMKAGKMVVFDSEGRFTLNKFTGECVPIEDDGTNFTQEELVIPQSELANVLRNSVQGSTQDFHWPAN